MDLPKVARQTHSCALMLKRLPLHRFTVVENDDFELGPGLNVIAGRSSRITRSNKNIEGPPGASKSSEVCNTQQDSLNFGRTVLPV